MVFRTAEGTKLAASVLGRAVAFEIDGYDPEHGEAWSVVIKGQATEIERMQDVFDALDLPLFPWHASPKHRFVRDRAVRHQRPPVPRARLAAGQGPSPAPGGRATSDGQPHRRDRDDQPEERYQ